MVERPADHRAKLQSAACPFLQAVDARGEQGLQVLGDGNLVDLCIWVPVAAAPVKGYGPGIDESARKLLYEERVALGLCKDYLMKLGRRIRDVKEVSKQHVAVLVRQRTQRYLRVAVGEVGLGGLLYAPGRRLAVGPEGA